jgi:hypothetical protein
MVAVRMKTAFLSRKRGPFNRLMSPSLLRYGTLEAELQPMVTGIGHWPSGLTRFLQVNRCPASRIKSEGLPRSKTLQAAPIATRSANP